MKVLYGERTKGCRYRNTSLPSIVGKTVQAIARTKVEGAYGDEPCIVLLFTDGTKHGFVLPQDT